LKEISCAYLGSSTGLSKLPFETHHKRVDNNTSSHAICEKYHLLCAAPEGDAGNPVTMQRLNKKANPGECKSRVWVWQSG